MTKTYKLVTSNVKKLKEFNDMDIDITIEKGKDLKEVDCDNPFTVITYKSMDAGSSFVVEDTSLNIDGLNFGTNIRWMLNDLKSVNNKKAEWIVLLGANDGEYIYIFKGIIKGTIINVNIIPEDNFGFDCYFVPDGETKTLYELKKENNNYSARKNAIINFKNNNYCHKFLIKNIKKWEGPYQHDVL